MSSADEKIKGAAIFSLTQQRNQVRDNEREIGLFHSRNQQSHVDEIITIMMVGGEGLEAVLHRELDSAPVLGELSIRDVEAMIVPWTVCGRCIRAIQPPLYIPEPYPMRRCQHGLVMIKR